MTTVLNILTFVIISACFMPVNAGESIMACMLNNLGLLAVRELQFLTICLGFLFSYTLIGKEKT